MMKAEPFEGMETTPLVSVVVPFYNVESYVAYCVESLLGQTYRHCEFVLVDDGSNDGTSLILEELEERDARIKVYRKKNGGLSDARNHGVRKSTGQYITFVDGDDVVSPFYVEYLVRALNESGAEHIVGQYVQIPLSGSSCPQITWSSSFSYREMDVPEMIRTFMYGAPIISACGHLASRELYEKHPFPCGRCYEDSLSFRAHIAEGSSFAVLDDPIYGYVKRRGSITKPTRICEEQVNDFLDAVSEVRESAKDYSADERGIIYYTALEYSRLFRLISKSDSKGNASLRKELVFFIRSNLWSLLLDGNAPLGNKARFLVLAGMPHAYDRVFRWYETNEEKHFAKRG